MLTNDEINKYIHEQIMGECWHSPEYSKGSPVPCLVCGHSDIPFINPDYCSDASPRSLLNEVVAKVPFSAYYNALVNETITYTEPGDREQFLATAEQIARACVEAHKNQ